MTKRTVMTAVIGSHLHGLATETSDIDLATVVCSPLIELLSPFRNQKIKRTLTQFEEHTKYELNRFCLLAAQGNPTILEVLWSNKIMVDSPMAEELRANRHRFIDTQRVGMAHLGYSMNQNRAALNNSDAEYDRRRGKFSAAAVRVLSQGIAIVNTGDFDPKPQHYVDLMRRAKQGITWNQFHDEIQPVLETLKLALLQAMETTTVRREPDMDYIEDFVLRAYTADVADAHRSGSDLAS